jgi:hypothetical protein
MDERRRAPYAGAEVDEDIGGADARLVHHAQQRVHGAWQIGDAVARKIGAIIRKLAESKDGIEPKVSCGGSHTKERPPKLARVMTSLLNELAGSFGPLAVVGLHAVERIAGVRRAVVGPRS